MTKNANPTTFSQYHSFEMHCGSPEELGCDADIRSRTPTLYAKYTTFETDGGGDSQFHMEFVLDNIEQLPGTVTEKNVKRVPMTDIGQMSLTVYFSPKEGRQ